MRKNQENGEKIVRVFNADGTTEFDKEETKMAVVPKGDILAKIADFKDELRQMKRSQDSSKTFILISSISTLFILLVFGALFMFGTRDRFTAQDAQVLGSKMALETKAWVEKTVEEAIDKHSDVPHDLAATTEELEEIKKLLLEKRR